MCPKRSKKVLLLVVEEEEWFLTLLQQLFLDYDKVISELVEQLCPKSRGKRAAIARLTENLERLKIRLAPLKKLALRTEIAQLMLYGELRKPQYAQAYYTVAKSNRSFLPRGHAHIAERSGYRSC